MLNLIANTVSKLSLIAASTGTAEASPDHIARQAELETAFAAAPAPVKAKRATRTAAKPKASVSATSASVAANLSGDTVVAANAGNDVTINLPGPTNADVPPVSEAATVDPTITGIMRRAARDERTVAAYRYPAGLASSRDDAYLAHYLAVSLTDGTDPSKPTFNNEMLARLDLGDNATRNRFYNGSNKSGDAGALQRAVKLGNVAARTDATTGRVSYTLTERGISQARLLLSRLAPDFHAATAGGTKLLSKAA